MIQLRRRRCLWLVLIALLAFDACGKKGRPLPPLLIVPSPVSDFTARRLGSEVYVQFMLSITNTNGSRPADLATVEVYGLTAGPLPPGESPLTDREFIEAAMLLAEIDVRPPPDPDEVVTEAEEEPGPDPDAEPPQIVRPEPVDPDDRLPVQGSVVTIVERLTPEVFALTDLSEVRDSLRDREDEDDDEPERRPRTAAPLGLPRFESQPTRLYAVVGVTDGGRRGPMTTPHPVRLSDPPRPISYVNIRYSESLATIAWLPARGTRHPPEPAVSGALSSTPILDLPTPTRYNVYEEVADIDEDMTAPAPIETRAPPPPVETATEPTPLNDDPVELRLYGDDRVEFGVERCYVVRAIDSVDGLPIASEPSPDSCVTFIDTFPPATPTNLAAVGSASAIGLIWEANTDTDLAGYLVLRAEAPSETLQPLTPEPIVETTYRDTAVTPGVTYVYAVVAVDTATPPNMSGQSTRVEEAPR